MKERMHALEEKNNLNTEFEMTKKKLEECSNDKVKFYFFLVATPQD